MKKLLIIACLFASVARAEFFDGNRLLQHMQGTTSERLIALGYVMGVWDRATGTNHCPPPNVTAGQLRDVVLKHLEGSPSVRHFSADVIVSAVLEVTWPCKSNNSGTGRSL